jgi:hypothetical protein
MSKFLSPEAEQALLSRLDGTDNEEIEESNQEVELESSSEQEDVYEDSSTSQNDDDYEDSSPSAEESGHNVPYSRFKEVVHARNTLRDTEAELRAEIEELQSLISAPDDNDDYEEYEATDEVGEYDWVDDNGEAAAPYDDSRMASIEDRIYQFEVQKAEYDIQREIKQSQKHYPNVPEEILLQAVIQNPEVEILDIAEQYNTFVSGIEQQAVASYQQEHKLAAPPRPSSSGQTRGEFRDVKKPRTLDDARLATLQYLKSL